MRVLVVNGFETGEPAPAVDRAISTLTGAGHEITRSDLAAEGFDRFMTAAEREAYHSDRPLITDEAAAAAEAIGASTGLVLCYPLRHGTCPPRVKSWQERVFVLGVAFQFKPSGRITGALAQLERACVVAVAPRPDRRDRRRNGQGRSLARSFHLSSNRRCRASFVVTDADDPSVIERALRRW